MNILYVLNSGKMGGMERHVLDLAKGMVKEGASVFVWCPQGEMVEKYSSCGAKVTEISINKDIDISYIRKLKKFLRNEKVEIVHAHELKAVINSLLAGYLAGVKVRISHTHTPISTWKINPLKRAVDSLVYSFFVNTLSSREIALTESVGETKISEGIRKEKIYVIPNALDEEVLSVSPEERKKYRDEVRNLYSVGKDDFVFGCISRLTREKGHDILIRAFKVFREKMTAGTSKVYLLIAGSGALDKSLKDLVHELNLDSSIIFTGAFNDEEKPKILSAMDAFVFPSYTEGFGIVLIEAMYFGIPTIASGLRVLEEVGKDKVTYFETGSYTDLAEKMLVLYKNYNFGRPLCVAGTEFTMAKFIESYLNLYKSLL